MGSGLVDSTNPVFEMSKKEGYITSPGMTKRFVWIYFLSFYFKFNKLLDYYNKNKDEKFGQKRIKI